jgi:hypothetical protein
MLKASLLFKEHISFIFGDKEHTKQEHSKFRAPNRAFLQYPDSRTIEIILHRSLTSSLALYNGSSLLKVKNAVFKDVKKHVLACVGEIFLLLQGGV